MHAISLAIIFPVIKSLTISIPAGVHEFENTYATLSQPGYSTLLSADVSRVKYMLGRTSEVPTTVRVELRENEQIATSTGAEDGGFLKLDFSTDSLLICADLCDDRSLPFKNTGAVSIWILEL